MDEFINVSHVFINEISRYIATSCDLKNERNKKTLHLVFFFIVPLSSTHPRFKNLGLL